MNFHAPQIIWLFLVGAGVGYEFSRHGEEKEGKHNGWATLLANLLSAALLYWGGFFK